MDPFDPQLLRDYDYFCRRFGHLEFREFAELWETAGALIEEGVAEGWSLEDLRAFVRQSG